MGKLRAVDRDSLLEDAATVDSARVSGAQTLRKGLSLLDIVADSSEPLRFRDLAERAGLPNGTLHRLVQTLIDYRLLRLDEGDQSYRLGARVFEMAHHVWNDFDLVAGAGPELDRLRELSRETARVGVLENGRVLVVDQRETMHPVRLAQGIGTRVPPHASALGKAMLAYVAEEELADMLAVSELSAFTERTITDPAALRRELALCKARGYAVSVEEHHRGINAVAAAVLDHRGRPVGAVSVTAPAFRFDEAQMHLLARDLMKSARRISGNIGEVAMSIETDPRPGATTIDAATCLTNVEPLLGEGPVWLPDSGRLLWIDILAPAVMTTTPDGRHNSRHDIDEVTGVVVPRESGGFLAATQSGIYSYELDSGKGALISAPESDLPGNRFNDGKCDARGRFWVGTFAIDASPGQGSLYCLDIDGRVHRAASGFHVSNGLGWSPDDSILYFTDSGRRTIYAYDFDVDQGRLGKRREFVRIDEGEARPDGLAVDVEGGVWVAHWDGWRVVRYGPDGRVDRVITVPVPRPTSLAFGGSEMSTLFVTSARVRLSALQLAEAPLSGGLFAIDAGIRGVTVRGYAG